MPSGKEILKCYEEIVKMSKIIIPITRTDLLEEMKRDYNEETYGYYSCDEGLINILMKEKYLKKWIMKKKYGFKFQMIKYLMKRKCFVWV